MARWTLHDMPDQSGRLAVVTGASIGGLGYETALALAGKGAEVVLAGRNPAKGAAALAAIQAQHPRAVLRVGALDLASLASVAAFAETLRREGRPLDLLVNNAGVMMLPRRQTTADGFEMQLGTNYLGHFALTGRLLDLLRRGRQPRVVNLASLAHRRGSIRFDDLQRTAYAPWSAYEQSKLAMLMFAFELQRRSDAGAWGVTSIAAHPGWSRTELFANGRGASGGGLTQKLFDLAARVFAQSVAAGALPTLYAATAPAAQGGAYYGPDGFQELAGAPAAAKIAPQATDQAAAARLWQVSEQLTGVSFAAAAARAA